MTEPDPRSTPFAPGGGQPAEAFTERAGVVATFDDQVGAGTIVDDATGAPWRFHCTAVADGTRTIAEGTAVVVDVAPGLPGRWEATVVTPA